MVQREVAFHVLSQLPNVMHPQVKKELSTVYNLLESTLSAPAPPGNREREQHAEVQVAAMKAVASYIGSCESNKDMKPLQPLLPHMLRCIGTWLRVGAAPSILPSGEDGTMVSGGEDGDVQEFAGRAAMDALLEISDVNTRFLKPYLADLTTAMLDHVAVNTNLESATRRLAVELMVELAEKAPAMMKTQKGFVHQIVTVALSLMVSGVDTTIDLEVWSRWGTDGKGDEASEQEEDGEDQALFEQGLEALDRLAMIPSFSAKIMPACFSYVPQFLANPDWRYRLVALFSISQTGEGCGKDMKKHLAELVASILPLLRDENPRVRWAATNCLGQLSTDLGPALQSNFHSQILPALTAAMDPSHEPNLRVRAHAAAATINFCEKAEKDILGPYLEGVLRQLASLMQAPHRKASEQSITTVAALALAVGELFAPYYHEFMPFLKTLLRLPKEQCNGKLRGKTLECVSLIGVAVGPTLFREDAIEVMQMLVAEGLEMAGDDPSITYLHQACGRMCRCLGPEFAPFLPALLPGLLRSASLQPDVKVDENLDSDEEIDGMETIQVGDAMVGIKTSMLEEKATACHLLVTYIQQLEEAFFPYLEQVGKEMKPLLSFLYHEDVRLSAIQSMAGMCRSAASHVRKNNADPAIIPQVVAFVLPDLLTTLEEEVEVAVQAQCARSIGMCVEDAGNACLTTEQLAAIADSLVKVLDDSKERVVEVLGARADREDEDEEDEEEDDYESEEEVRMTIEQEEELVEALIMLVGKLIATHGSAIDPVLMEKILPPFLTMIDAPVHPTQARLGIAMLDDVLEIGGAKCAHYVKLLLPRMLQSCTNTDSDLRQAALFGVGLAATMGGAEFGPFAHEAVQVLRHVTGQPDARSEEKESATDNAIASLGRIVALHSDSLHPSQVDQVWVEWLGYLPLKADEAEAVVVHRELCRHVVANQAGVMGADHANLPRIIAIFAQVLETEGVDTEVTGMIREIVNSAHTNVPHLLGTACKTLSPALLLRLQNCASSTPAPALTQAKQPAV